MDKSKSILVLERLWVHFEGRRTKKMKRKLAMARAKLLKVK
jgi:hypothetical protein